MRTTTLVSLLLLSVSPLNAVATKRDVSHAAQLDKIFTSLTDSRSPGVAVLVRRNNRTVFKRGYGVTDLKSQTPIDAHTNFRLASCTKQFTAMAVMLLVHDGKLRYDEPMTEIFPDFPAYGKSITIRNLLNHTSGLPDYEELMEKASPNLWNADHQIQDAEVLKLLESEDHGKFAPGTKWSYSNSGYVTLGLIVAKVSGEPFGDFLSKRIFRPLKMRHTVAFVKGKNEVSHRAYGHSKEDGTFEETDQSATSATLGDGGVYSNLEDLARWDDALAHHKLLGEPEMQPALTPFKLPDGSLPLWQSDPGDTDPQAGKSVSYGFGWFLDPYKGHARMWHYGDTVGFKTAIERFTADRLTVIVLSNRSDLDAGVLAAKVADVYFAESK